MDVLIFAHLVEIEYFGSELTGSLNKEFAMI